GHSLGGGEGDGWGRRPLMNSPSPDDRGGPPAQAGFGKTGAEGEWHRLPPQSSCSITFRNKWGMNMGKGRRLTAPLLTSLLLVALSVVLSSVTGCSIVAAADGHGAPPLVVHFFDVGQGDATLLQHGDVTILIDAGRHDRRDVLPYLQAAGVERLTLVIATHPHADHIGQMDQVIRTFPVEEVWMSGNEHTSRVFERRLDASF